MPIRDAKRIKVITIALRRRVGTRKRHLTTRSRTPFRHPTQFQLGSRPRPPSTTTDKGLTEAFRSQRSEQLQQEECKCPERSQTSWSAYSNASNRLSTELARSAHARTGSAIPLRSWAPRSCSSNKLPISFRVLSALIVVAERTGGSSHQRK